MILVDTSVWIDFFKGTDTPQQRILHRLIEDDEDICLTGIVLTEILQGIKTDTDFERIKELLIGFPLYEPALDAYLDSAGIYRTCRKAGRTIRSTIDCLIAAICIRNSLSILHRDRDYGSISRVTSLKVVTNGSKDHPSTSPVS